MFLHSLFHSQSSKCLILVYRKPERANSIFTSFLFYVFSSICVIALSLLILSVSACMLHSFSTEFFRDFLIAISNYSNFLDNAGFDFYGLFYLSKIIHFVCLLYLVVFDSIRDIGVAE